MIYTYTCDTCGKDAERVLPMSEHDSPQICECGATLRKTFNVQAPIMKDKNNWYVEGVDKPVYNKTKGGVIAEPNRKSYATASEEKAGGIKVYQGGK